MTILNSQVLHDKMSHAKTHHEIFGDLGFVADLADTLQAMVPGVVALTDATLTLSAALHGNKQVVVDRAAGSVLTLPAATGSGSKFEVICKTTITSNALTVQAPDSDTTFQGNAIIAQDGADTGVLFEAGATADTVSMNGTTTGGLAGAKIVATDIGADLYQVDVVSAATGTEATPFSAAV